MEHGCTIVPLGTGGHAKRKVVWRACRVLRETVATERIIEWRTSSACATVRGAPKGLVLPEVVVRLPRDGIEGGGREAAVNARLSKRSRACGERGKCAVV